MFTDGYKQNILKFLNSLKNKFLIIQIMKKSLSIASSDLTEHPKNKISHLRVPKPKKK